MKNGIRNKIAVFSLAAALPLGLVPTVANGATAVPSDATAVQSGADEYPNSDTENLTAKDRADINRSLTSLGYSPLPKSAAALTLNGDKIVVLDKDGDVIPIDKGQDLEKASLVQTKGVTDEIKRTVGACIGIDLTANVGAWAAIESQVNTWQKAAKFVLRRVGFIAAISCGGGVFAEYLL